MSEEVQTTKTPLISLSDFTPDELACIGEIAFQYGQSPSSFAGVLDGMRVGLIFMAPSTRTRASFWTAARTLGCDVLNLGPADLQISTGETWLDTAAVLTHYLDSVVVRTNGPQRELREMASKIPATINALTYEEHPTQAFADSCALREYFGTLEDLRVAYLGQANNTARALALFVCKTPRMELDVYSPPGLGFEHDEISALNKTSHRNAVHLFDHVPSNPDPVDVVYTTRWRSMGVAPEDPDWISRFEPFAITENTMKKFSGSTEAMFMHDLPAVRNQEVSSDVLDGRISLVHRQAFHKASAAAAALLWALRKGMVTR
ncbi:MAG: ornithine carbamoyltransferase [Gammaproteobacteria bacterium]